MTILGEGAHAPYSSTTRRAASLLAAFIAHSQCLPGEGQEIACERSTSRDVHLCRVLCSRSAHGVLYALHAWVCPGVSMSYEGRVEVVQSAAAVGAEVSTPLLCCSGRAAQETQGVIASPVCDFVHNALYDLSRKRLTIFICKLQGVGSLQKHSCRVLSESHSACCRSPVRTPPLPRDAFACWWRPCGLTWDVVPKPLWYYRCGEICN